MIIQTEGTIFLADNRPIYQIEDWYQNYALPKDFLKSVGLLGLKDETLQAQHSLTIKVVQSSLFILLPLVGSLDCSLGDDELITVEVGQILVFSVLQGADYQLTNPYEQGLINYLSIQLPYPKIQTNLKSQIISLTLDSQPNNLQKLVLNPSFEFLKHQFYIGKFGGREEEVFIPQNPQNEVFSFVIAGAFEVQNRLLQPRDALILWNTDTIEFESLSQAAIILMIEQLSNPSS